MTHLRALRVQDEMSAAGMRSFVARQQNGKRWVWVVVHTTINTTVVFETAVQWSEYKQEVAA